jgi:G3E family GTPase
VIPYQEPEYLPWDGRRVPITFIGGYLGAGKTSLINELLAYADRPIAVIVNDVGSVNVDAALIRTHHGDTIELTDGCVCCSAINGIGAAFDQIRARLEPPDHVVIELSGVAESQRMLPWGDSAGFMLDGVVIVVAAEQLIAGVWPEWLQSHIESEVISADLVVLTKTDLISAQMVELAECAVDRLAPTTTVFRAGKHEVGPGAVGRFLALGGRTPKGALAVPNATLFDAHRVETVILPTALPVADLYRLLDDLPTRIEGEIVRVKGLVNTTDAGLVNVQIVGRRHVVEPVRDPERLAPTDLIVISLPKR